MNITIEQLKFLRAVLDATDVKMIAKTVGCTPAMVRHVLSYLRSNDEIEYLCYKRAKEKTEKTSVILGLIEDQNKEYISTKRRSQPKLFK